MTENIEKIHALIPKVADVATALIPFEENVVSFEEQLARADIEEETDYRKGEVYLQSLKSVVKALKQSQDEKTGELKLFLKWIDQQYKALKDRLDVADKAMRQKMLAFKAIEDQRLKDAQEAEKRKQDEAALEAAAKAEESGDKKTAEAILEAAERAPAPPPTGFRGIGTSNPKRWVGTVVDVREVCKAIAKGDLPEDIVKFGQRELNTFAKRHGKEETTHGISIEHKTTISVR